MWRLRQNAPSPPPPPQAQGKTSSEVNAVLHSVSTECLAVLEAVMAGDDPGDDTLDRIRCLLLLECTL